MGGLSRCLHFPNNPSHGRRLFAALPNAAIRPITNVLWFFCFFVFFSQRRPTRGRENHRAVSSFILATGQPDVGAELPNLSRHLSGFGMRKQQRGKESDGEGVWGRGGIRAYLIYGMWPDRRVFGFAWKQPLAAVCVPSPSAGGQLQLHTPS